MKSCGAALYLFTRLNNAFTTPLILPDDVLHEKSVRSLLVRFQFLVFLKNTGLLRPTNSWIFFTVRYEFLF